MLFPTVLQRGDEARRPRQELFEHINYQRTLSSEKKIVFPTYFLNAQLDKCSLDILEALVQNPRNRGKSLYDIIEEYVRVEEIVFSNAQANGLSNIDDMDQLRVKLHPLDLGPEDRAIVNEHLPGARLYQYEGALVSSNRGLLHIHDAFAVSESGLPSEHDYKPLLMLLGSGKVSVDSTQTSIDNTVVITTNLEEMHLLEKQLTSSKLLDRIEKIPVNYLLDANAEMDILQRDMANMKEKFEVDPNLLQIAAYFAVMTRLLPPSRPKNAVNWSSEKRQFYSGIHVEQKLMIYAYQAEDPVSTIREIPHWHPFRNEALKLGIELDNPATYEHLISRHPRSIPLSETGLFSVEELRMIDDELMRELWLEHYPNEGKNGLSVRQLQNVMRNTIAHSDGRKVHVGTFLSQLKRLISEGPAIHHWLAVDPKFRVDRKGQNSRKIGQMHLAGGEGEYGDFAGLVKVLQGIYFNQIRREITVSTVDRDPEEIERDLRKYLQHALLANALENKAFAHVMVPRYTFVDPKTGLKIDQPDMNFMSSMERVLAVDIDGAAYRRMMAKKFLEHQNVGEIELEPNKSVISSRNDHLLTAFAEPYHALLSHRRSVNGVNVEQLRDAFFQKRNSPEVYEQFSDDVRNLVEAVLTNMVTRYQYPPSIALDTVVFALRKNIVNFEDMIS